MKIALSLWAGAAVVGAGLSAAGVAGAAPIAGVSDLQDLIDLGAAGVVVDGVRYYSFGYSSTESGGADAPAPSEIGVQSAPGPVGTSGLEFSFDWTAAGVDNAIESTITYRVQSAPAIDRVGLFFDGDVPPGNEGAGTEAGVTETIRTLGGAVLGTLNVFDDGAGPGADNNADFLDLAPPQGDLDVTKVIAVSSDGPGTATISIVDNTFRQVPEPASLGLLGLGGVMALRRRRA